MPNTIPAAGGAMPAAKPTDKQIVDAIDALLADVQRIRCAVVVMDEHTNNEFRNSRLPKGTSSWDFGLSEEQVLGITYLTDHVRGLAWDLERAIDKAFGLGVQQ